MPHKAVSTYAANNCWWPPRSTPLSHMSTLPV